MSAVLVFVYLLVYSALFLDSYKNPIKFEHVTMIGPSILMLLSLLINILARFNKITLPQIFINLNKYLIFPLFSLLAIGLSIWSYSSPSNFVYSKIPLNTIQLALISLLALLISLANAKGQFLKRNWKQIVFLIPPVILFLGLIASLWPSDFFITLNKEDHLVENTQFLLLFLGFIFSLSLGLKKKKIFLAVALLLFIMAGEEISWGQRIFGIITPEYIANQNSQGEINVHNIGIFSQFTNIGYLIIGLYGSISWIFRKKYLIPWFLSLYFLPIFIYNLLLPPTAPHGLGEWSEMTELLMYGGMLGLVLLNYFKKYGS